MPNENNMSLLKYILKEEDNPLSDYTVRIWNDKIDEFERNYRKYKTDLLKKRPLYADAEEELKRYRNGEITLYSIVRNPDNILRNIILLMPLDLKEIEWKIKNK